MENTSLIVREADQPWETWDDPDIARRSLVDWKNLLSGDRTASEGLSLGIAQIHPGATLIRHRHAPPEVYYILDGTGVVEINETLHTIASGTAVFIPGSTPHRFTNTGPAIIRFIYVFPVDSFSEITYVFEPDEQ